MGGSGDEYSYSETNPDGWQSDIWVSYLVVLDTEVHTIEITYLQFIILIFLKKYLYNTNRVQHYMKVFLETRNQTMLESI